VLCCTTREDMEDHKKHKIRTRRPRRTQGRPTQAAIWRFWDTSGPETRGCYFCEWGRGGPGQSPFNYVQGTTGYWQACGLRYQPGHNSIPEEEKNEVHCILQVRLGRVACLVDWFISDVVVVVVVVVLRLGDLMIACSLIAMTDPVAKIPSGQDGCIECPGFPGSNYDLHEARLRN
jgi:hypothetical protein